MQYSLFELYFKDGKLAIRLYVYFRSNVYIVYNNAINISNNSQGYC